MVRCGAAGLGWCAVMATQDATDFGIMDDVDAAMLAADEARREIVETIARLRRMHTLAEYGEADASHAAEAQRIEARMRAMMEAMDA